TDVRYTTAAIVLPLSALATLRLLSPRARATGVRTAAAVALGLALLSPVYVAHLDVRRRNPAIEEQTAWTIPNGPTRIPESFLNEGAPMAVPLAAVFVAVAGGLLRWTGGAGGRIPAAAVRHALLWSVVGIYLTIDAVITAGGTLVRMPHTVLLQWLGTSLLLRAPLRLGVAALMGVALLAALGFATCAQWLGARTGGRHALA